LFRREQTLQAGSRGYHRRWVDAGDFGPQAGDQDVAEDGLAGRDEDGGAEELEDCVGRLACALLQGAMGKCCDRGVGVLTVEDCGCGGDILVRG
jgi:hypothetical protein